TRELRLIFSRRWGSRSWFSRRTDTNRETEVGTVISPESGGKGEATAFPGVAALEKCTPVPAGSPPENGPTIIPATEISIHGSRQLQRGFQVTTAFWLQTSE